MSTYQIGGTTLQLYTEFLKDAFLIFEVERYHKNLKVQNRDSKKIYSIDVGLRNQITKSLTEDSGKIMENLVFLKLIRSQKRIYYFKENLETDFVVVENHKVVEAIQVTDSNLEDTKVYDREIYGLLECLNATDLNSGTILTKNRKDNLKIGNHKIYMVPIKDWLFDH